ncbi:hypothetical protein C1336_000270009 [Campylobacter jejuni subsp. jejuni 1336]|nr:hypothetical protein C1336_000270009 [Campylobacter jejuni subsp. jejuni 1336]
MPDTKPDLHFDEEGICDACRSQEAKKSKKSIGKKGKKNFLSL